MGGAGVCERHVAIVIQKLRSIVLHNTDHNAHS